MLSSWQLAARSVSLWAQASRLLATSSDAVAKSEAVKELATTRYQENPTIELPGQAFVGDLRSTSGLCVGDHIGNHTAKWNQPEIGGNQTSPLEFIQASAPLKVHGLVHASYGGDPAAGCPVEYINLKGTTFEAPAVCKYTGNKFYSDDWKEGGVH